MATLEQMLLRLPRKTPDADFVDRLFQRIHREEIVTRVIVSRPPFERWRMEAYPPFTQEEEGASTQEEGRPVEATFYLHPPRLIQQRRSSPQTSTITRYSFLWATEAQTLERSNS